MRRLLPIPPTERRIQESCKRFDKENEVAEQAIAELFAHYPRHDSHPGVLLKVVVLNRLYSTNIYAVDDVARHIFDRRERIDSDLQFGSPDVVDLIGNVTLSATGKERHMLSFATKYCSWHRQDVYPIWDSRVERYLRMMKDSDFGVSLGRPLHSWNQYAEFVGTMTALRAFYRLERFSFKDLDKFVWMIAETADRRRDS